jgi:choice-of-anchor A domain-containing protein
MDFEMKATITFLAGLLLAGSAALADDLSVKEILNTYNGVTFGDLTSSSQGIDGSAYVGGNLSGNMFSVGEKKTSDTGTTLYVGGETSVKGINAAQGNVYLNGSDKVSTSFEKQGNGNLGVYVKGAFSGRDNQKVVHANQGDLSAAAPAISAASVSKYSTYLSTLSGHSYNGKDFNVTNDATQSEGTGWDASKVTVYNTSFKELKSGSQNFVTNLKANSGETLIINVAGDSGTFTLNSNSGKSIAGQVIWNFYEATDVKIDRSITGAVLAPNATLSGFSGWTNGSVIANSMKLSNGGLRNTGFVGDLPSMLKTVTNVPEIGGEGMAAAMILVLGSLAAMTGRRRRMPAGV